MFNNSHSCSARASDKQCAKTNRSPRSAIYVSQYVVQSRELPVPEDQAAEIYFFGFSAPGKEAVVHSDNLDGGLIDKGLVSASNNLSN